MKIGDKVYRAHINYRGEVEIEENDVAALGRRVRLRRRKMAWATRLDVDFAECASTPEDALVGLLARIELDFDITKKAHLDAAEKLRKVRDAQGLTRPAMTEA
jgi:hypothetical protein